MKKTKGIIIFSWTIVGILVLHFTITSVYSFSFLPWPESVRSVSMKYSIPLFHQNWKMFAPNIPKYENQLEFRNFKDGHWSSWRDASRSMGFEKNSKVEYMEQTTCSGLSYQVANNLMKESKGKEFERIVQSFDFGKAMYFVHELYDRVNHEYMGDSLQIRLAYLFTSEPGSPMNTSWSYVEFPAEAYHP